MENQTEIMCDGQIYDPPHPGEVLKELYIKPLNITINQLSKMIGVERKSISRILNGHTRISAEMALKLGKVLNTSPDLWLNMQHSYDIWHTKKHIQNEIDKIIPITYEYNSFDQPSSQH